MRDQASHMREIARQYRQSSLEHRPYMISISSGKGGVGKSMVALNLGIALAGLGQRVLLVDADANLGALDVMAGVAPRFRLGHVLRGEMDIEDVLVSLAPGLKLLPASSGDVTYPTLTGEQQGQLIDDLLQIQDHPDLVLVDTSAGLSADILGFAGRADETFVVTTPEPTAVMDAYALMKVIWSGRPDALLRLLVNNVRGERDADDTASKLRMAVAHFLKRDLPCLNHIPNDSSVGKAVIQQQPLLRAFPRSAAALALQVLGRIVKAESLSSSERKAALV